MECPVCRAQGRGEASCRRCRADLAPLLWLSTRAWQLRERARQALAAGRPELAARLAGRAQRLRSHPSGEALVQLAEWVMGSPGGPTRPGSEVLAGLQG